MKKSLLAVAFALGASGAIAQATSTTSTQFNVTVALTPTCNVKTGADDIDFGAYTPFTNPDKNLTNATTVTFRCSQGIVPASVGFVAASAGTTQVTTTTASGTVPQSAVGVIKGLRYTLSMPALSRTVAGTAASAGTAGAGGNNSTAQEYSLPITAFMAGAQAGGTGGDTSHTWQVVLTY